MEVWKLLFDVVLLLTGALVLGGIFSRFGQSPLLGYLAAGMFMGGPGGAGLLQKEHEIESIAELGVSLLLFSLGLEFSWNRLKSLGGKTMLIGAIQVTVTLAVAAAVCAWLGSPVRQAIALGGMIALSSTACCLRVLMERGALDSVHGRNTLAILLVQDLAVVPLAIMMTILSGTGTPTEIALGVGKTIGLAMLLVAGMYLLLCKVAVAALGTLTLERNRELTVLLAVATGLGSAWAAHQVGLSPALGAFGAGLFLAGSPFATQIRADVSSLRVILLTLFFGAAGMVANPGWIWNHLGLVLSVTAAIMTGKALLIWIIFVLSGRTVTTGVATGLCLSQIGEFAFVIGRMATDGNVITSEANQTIISAAIFSLFLTPLLIPLAPRIGAQVQRVLSRGRSQRSDPDNAETRARPDVVIVGFGPAGLQVGHALGSIGREVHVVDLNQQAQRAAAQLGFHGHVGDATQGEILEHLHIEHAQLVAITIPDRQAALLVLAQVRRLAPQAHIIVRCRYDRFRGDFEAAGAHEIIQDETQVGMSLAERALAALGSDAGRSAMPAVEG